MLGAYLFVSVLKYTVLPLHGLCLHQSVRTCVTKVPRAAGLRHQTFLSRTSGGRKSKGRAPADLVPVGLCFLPRWPSSHRVLMWQRGQGALWSPFYKGINLFHACLLMQETRVRSLGWEDPLEEEMASHSSILVWRIPWTEEPGGLQSTGSQSQTLIH